jgi:hypothetical protein
MYIPESYFGERRSFDKVDKTETGCFLDTLLSSLRDTLQFYVPARLFQEGNSYEY